MSWDEVQTFLAIARAGQLQQASVALGLDRTTVGRRLSALEAQLGQPLFLRTREGLSLTTAGTAALEHANRMDAAARALTSVVTPPSEVTGLVRLAVTDALAPFLVEHGLLSLCETHPGLRLEVLAGNRRLDLLRDEADLAIRVDPLRGASLRTRCLSRTPVALYASSEYLARRDRPRTPKQLRTHDALVPSGELAMLPEGKWLAQNAGNVVFSSNSLPTLVAAARAGQGMVALTTSWGEREHTLERLFDVPGLPPRALWLVSTEVASKRPACAAVIGRLVELFARARARREDRRD